MFFLHSILVSALQVMHRKEKDENPNEKDNTLTVRTRDLFPYTGVCGFPVARHHRDIFCLFRYFNTLSFSLAFAVL